MKYYEKDDSRGIGQPVWFAKADIDARAAAVYKQHSEFFDHAEHKARVAVAVAVATAHAKSCGALCETARNTRKHGIHTEVKLHHVEFNRGMRDQLAAALHTMGYTRDQYEYRPQSQSFRIFVQ